MPDYSEDLQTIFKSYRRRDWLNLYLADNTPLNLSRGAVLRNAILYDNWISSVEELNASIDTAIDRITIHCQNVNSLLGFNVASNLRLLDYAVAEYGKIYESTRNKHLSVDLDSFRGVLANAEVDEKRIAFELIVDYEALSAIVASRALAPRCWWTYQNGIECTTKHEATTCPKTLPACHKRGKPWEFGGFTFFEEATSDLPGSGGNEEPSIGNQPNCFTGETFVWTPDGNIPIGEMKERFEKNRRSVYSFDPATGEIIEDEILAVFEHQVTDFFTFWFDHTKINVTGEHPFLVSFGEWKNAEDFERGKDTTKVFDKIWSDSKLKKIKQNSDRNETVWNIHVKRNQTYFANHCAVHNKIYPEIGPITF